MLINWNGRGYAIKDPSNNRTLLAHSPPSLHAPIHPVQQGERCGLHTLNMLNWVLTARRDSGVDLPALFDRMADQDDLDAFVHSMNLTPEQRNQRRTRLEFADAVRFNEQRQLPPLEWASARFDPDGQGFDFMGDTTGAIPEDLDRIPAVGITYRRHDGASNSGDHSVLIAHDGRDFLVYDPQEPRPVRLNADTMRGAIAELAAERTVMTRFNGEDQGRFFDLLIPVPVLD